MDALERAIVEGVWKPGDQIPTEGALEKQFGASRGTLRMAVAELVRRGMLSRQPGRGTFVLGPSFQSLERYFRYESVDADPRIVPQNKILSQRIVKADAEIAKALGISTGDQVGHLRRLRSHRTEPFLVINSYFPLAYWEIIQDGDLGAHPLYDVFKDQFNLYVVSAEEFLRADLALSNEAALLGIAAESAVIRIERTAYTFERRPLEYRRAAGRADRFRYHVSLK